MNIIGRVINTKTCNSTLFTHRCFPVKCDKFIFIIEINMNCMLKRKHLFDIFMKQHASQFALESTKYRSVCMTLNIVSLSCLFKERRYTLLIWYKIVLFLTI